MLIKSSQYQAGVYTPLHFPHAVGSTVRDHECGAYSGRYFQKVDAMVCPHHIGSATIGNTVFLLKSTC